MFKKIFRLAFPERPEEKLDALRSRALERWNQKCSRKSSVLLSPRGQKKNLML